MLEGEEGEEGGRVFVGDKGRCFLVPSIVISPLPPHTQVLINVASRGLEEPLTFEESAERVYAAMMQVSRTLDL